MLSLTLFIVLANNASCGTNFGIHCDSYLRIVWNGSMSELWATVKWMVSRACFKNFCIEFIFYFFHIISRDPIIIFYVYLRCCISSWNGRCCEFPLDYEEEEPQDTVHHSNYFSIQVTTPKPRLNTKSRQFNYKSLFDGFLGRTRVRELPIPKDQKKPYQWWSESKWVQKNFRPSSTLYFNIWLLTRPSYEN